LYWTSRGAEIPAGRMDLLDEWADVDDRERALGIETGTPILIDPEHRVDPRLARFLGRSRFSFLAEGSRRSYVKDYRLFFSFLWGRGKGWDEADSDDIDDYEAWRRRSKDNPKRIGGAKWARELALSNCSTTGLSPRAMSGAALWRCTRFTGGTARPLRCPTTSRRICGSPMSSG
jgi:hypothetical protein